MKRRYKVLQLPSWARPGKDPMFERSFVASISRYKPIDPVFNRNGYYYDRMAKQGWIERDGKAWAMGDFRFKWDFRHGDDLRLEDRVYDAIKLLVDERLIDKPLRDLYSQELHARGRRRHRLNAFKAMKRMAVRSSD